jgi:hypothetical protein
MKHKFFRNNWLGLVFSAISLCGVCLYGYLSVTQMLVYSDPDSLQLSRLSGRWSYDPKPEVRGNPVEYWLESRSGELRGVRVPNKFPSLPQPPRSDAPEVEIEFVDGSNPLFLVTFSHQGRIVSMSPKDLTSEIGSQFRRYRIHTAIATVGAILLIGAFFYLPFKMTRKNQ